MRNAITKLRAVAVFFCFPALLDPTHGGFQGSIFFPECPNAGSSTIQQANIPCFCAQVSAFYNQQASQYPGWLPNVQQPGIYREQPQMIEKREQQLANAANQYMQYRSYQNVNPPTYQGNANNNGRSKRQVPYQIPYGATQYSNINPYQEGNNVMQSFAGLGFQPNAIQLNGFNQLVAPNSWQETPNQLRYNTYGDTPDWLQSAGYGVRPGPSFSPTYFSGGLQTMSRNLYGNSYPYLFGQYNQMNDFMGASNYQGQTNANYGGFFPYANVNGFLPFCLVNCQLPDPTPAPQPTSKWMNYEQLKTRLVEFANTQLATSLRSLEKPRTTTEVPQLVVASPIVASMSRALETAPTPKEVKLAPVVVPTSRAATDSQPIPQVGPATVSPVLAPIPASDSQPAEPVTLSPPELSPSSTSSPGLPIASEVASSQVEPITVKPSVVTYTVKSVETPKPIKAQRMLD